MEGLGDARRATTITCRNREQIAAHLGSEAVKAQLSSGLEDRRRAEREPYVRSLAELHHQMMAVMAYRDICESA